MIVHQENCHSSSSANFSIIYKQLQLNWNFSICIKYVVQQLLRSHFSAENDVSCLKVLRFLAIQSGLRQSLSCYTQLSYAFYFQYFYTSLWLQHYSISLGFYQSVEPQPKHFDCYFEPSFVSRNKKTYNILASLGVWDSRSSSVIMWFSGSIQTSWTS